MGLAHRWIALGAMAGTASVLATLAQAHLMREKSKALSATATLGFVASLAAMVWKP